MKRELLGALRATCFGVALAVLFPPKQSASQYVFSGVSFTIFLFLLWLQRMKPVHWSVFLITTFGYLFVVWASCQPRLFQ